MKSEYQEAYEIIEDLCNIHLGVGNKFILKKIMQESKEKGLEFSCDGAEYIIRKLSCFFPKSKGFDVPLKKINRSEKLAVDVYRDYWRKHYKK